MRTLFLFLACLLVTHFVFAQDDDDEPDSREYGAIIEGLEVKLEAEGLNEQNETVDKFALEVEALNEGKPGIAAIDLTYETIRNDTSKEIGFDIRIIKIVEFEIDNKTNGHYTNESVVIQEYYTNTGEDNGLWPTTGWVPISKNESGVIIDGFELTTTDGIVTLRGWYSGDSRFEYGVNTVKIDIEIHNFPYLEPNGTRVGMLASLEAEIEVESENDDEGSDDDDNDSDDDDATSLNIKPSDGRAFGKFAWADEADNNANKTYKVIGKAIRVPSEDDDENEVEFDLYFTFMTPKGEPIIWDPQVGVVYAAQPPSRRLETIIVLGVLFGTAAAIAIIWLVYYIVKKKSKQYEVLPNIEES